MNILLTGGAGFIGSNIADAYIKEGHKTVIIDNLYSGSEEFINSKSVFYRQDILDSDLDGIITKHKIDVINHHAAHIDLRNSVKEPIFDMESNLKTTLILLGKAVKHNIGRFIFASSGGAVYGEQEKYPSDETAVPNPVSPYGISKHASEQYIRFFGRYYGINYTILRYSNAYGPRQGSGGEAGVIGVFINRMLRNIQPIINGSGGNTRDFVYSADICRINLGVLQSPDSSVINVSSGTETSINELFSIINNEFGGKFTASNAPAVKGEQARSVLDNSAALKKFGWKNTVDLKTGIAETIKWYKERHGK